MARPKGRGKSKGGRQPGRFGSAPTDRQASLLGYFGKKDLIAESVFSLADEARQTSQHDHSYWSESFKLRSKPVQFISSGESDPLHESIIGANDAQLRFEAELEPATCRTQIHVDTSEERPETLSNLCAISDHSSPVGVDIDDRSVDVESVGGNSFFFDTHRKPKDDGDLRAPVVVPERELSPEADSSDEVILFRGRKKSSRKTLQTVWDTTTALNVAKEATEPQGSHSTTAQQVRPNRQAFGKRKAKKSGQSTTKVEDDILADYITNMRENGELDTLLGAPMHLEKPNGSGLVSSTEPSSDTEGIPAQLEQRDEKAGESEDKELDEDVLANLIAQHRLSSLSADDDAGSESSSDSQDTERPHFSHNHMMTGDEFDLMDWDRPSLHRPKKGKGTVPTFGSCDTHLEMQLQMAWKTDRQKKIERKQKREELRSLGLLHKKANTDDLRVKYPSGMNIQEVGDELRAFLQSEEDVLSFPPMDAHARSVIHDLARKFNFTSKSIGKADQRHPTLHRTKRTLKYSECDFDQALSRVRRRFMSRPSAKGKRGPKTSTSRGDSGAAASYNDGEVVGGEAPELGLNNRGRTMLEKMGWSKGTALGATDNKGILQPVVQTMKKSKAGLG